MILLGKTSIQKYTMEKYAKNEKDLIRRYEKMGYDHLYRFQDGALVDTNTNEKFSPEDILIVAEHRYEGMSNPSDLSILYIIESRSGNKGSMLAGYGPSANLELAEFFKEIPEENISNKVNINAEE